MNELEYSAYKVWWKFLVKHLPGRPNGVVYLRTTPEVCYKRMCERNREEEAGVPPDYLTVRCLPAYAPFSFPLFSFPLVLDQR